MALIPQNNNYFTINDVQLAHPMGIFRKFDNKSKGVFYFLVRSNKKNNEEGYNFTCSVICTVLANISEHEEQSDLIKMSIQLNQSASRLIKICRILDKVSDSNLVKKKIIENKLCKVSVEYNA